MAGKKNVDGTTTEKTVMTKKEEKKLRKLRVQVCFIVMACRT